MGPAIRVPPSCVCEGSSGREWETESKVSSCSGIQCNSLLWHSLPSALCNSLLGPNTKNWLNSLSDVDLSECKQKPAVFSLLGVRLDYRHFGEEELSAWNRLSILLKVRVELSCTYSISCLPITQCNNNIYTNGRWFRGILVTPYRKPNPSLLWYF